MSTAARVISPEVIIKDRWLPSPLAQSLNYNPQSRLGEIVREVVKYLPNTREGREMAAELIDRITSCVVVESALYGKITRGIKWFRDFGYGGERVIELGLLGRKVMTTTGMGFIVDAFQDLVELEDMKYHGLGTGSGAEAAADTALGTELTTEYTGNVRATGTTTEFSATAYQTVGANTLDGTPGAALREHGVFSQAATGGGVLLDRTVFAAVTLVSGDEFESDYRGTFTAGS